MLPGRSQGPWPNPISPNGSFMRPQPSNIQRTQPRNAPFFQQMPPQRRMGRQKIANGPFQQLPKKEGLLGKILGKSRQNSVAPNLFTLPSQGKQETRSGGGFLETLKNPEGISNMLNNTQRVLQAAEQFTPMIQQYSPIVKNLPSIWKLMRAFKSSDDEKAETKKEKSVIEKRSSSKRKQQDSSSSHSKPKQSPQKKKKDSVPKLYI